LNGVDLETESNTAMPREFLIQQMEWRDALEEAKSAKDIGALEQLESELRDTRKEEVAQISKLLDANDFAQAAQGVRQLMFLEKFGQEIARIFETIES
jgi:molecular chaperone HscB